MQDELCNGCRYLQFVPWCGEYKSAAQCMDTSNQFGGRRTLTVSRFGYVGRVYKPKWCRRWNKDSF